MDQSEAYLVSVKRPAVVSETTDGETIIMHHDSGHYFDTTGTGSLLWDAIATGATIPGLASLLSERTGADPAIARETVADFVQTLLRHDLVTLGGDGDGEGAAAIGTGPGERLDFAPPVLGVHTDLADLLLLDPIHDVGEAGWPSPPQLAAS